MRMTFVLLAAIAALGSCGDSSHPWRRPGPRDSESELTRPTNDTTELTSASNTGRSPCPMLNSLANHGFIHRNGLNISIDELVNGLDEALNLSPDSSRPVAQLAATTSTTGNPNTMNLADLDKHGGI